MKDGSMTNKEMVRCVAREAVLIQHGRDFCVMHSPNSGPALSGWRASRAARAAAWQDARQRLGL